MAQQKRPSKKNWIASFAKKHQVKKLVIIT